MNQQMGLGNIAEWVGAAANAIVAAVAVAVVFVQHCLERRRDRALASSISLSAADNAYVGLGLLTDLEEEIEGAMGSSKFDKAHWRFKLQIAASSIRVGVSHGHRDPALIRALIEAQAWIDYALDHIDDQAWLWSHLPTNRSDRNELGAFLQTTSRQLRAIV